MSSYWAAEGRVARTPIEGGIEITAQQYRDAIEGMMAGHVVSIVGGFSVADPPTAPEPEPEPDPPLTLEDFRRGIQAHIDQAAQSRDYDHGVSLASYVASTNPEWAAEAAAFVAWRDAVWAYALGELAKFEIGARAVPEDVASFVAEMPPMVWPD